VSTPVKVTVTGAWDSEEEARAIGEEIEQLQRNDGTGRPHELNEIAILVRASYQMREFEDRFVTPDDPREYVAVVGLAAHHERLPAELRAPFTDAVVAELPKPLTLRYVRLNLEATR